MLVPLHLLFLRLFGSDAIFVQLADHEAHAEEIQRSHEVRFLLSSLIRHDGIASDWRAAARRSRGQE